MIISGLCIVLLLVLILPFFFKEIEHNLEIFLFIMGVVATLISKQMSWHLSLEAITEPIPITLAVLVFGLENFRRRSICGGIIWYQIGSIWFIWTMWGVPGGPMPLGFQ